MTTRDDLGGAELTLGLPGGPKDSAHGHGQGGGGKRGFVETVELSLGSSGIVDGHRRSCNDLDGVESSASSSANPSPAKAQVVGWPPVKQFRKNTLKGGKYVKVAVDGAPYLRKVDLEMYRSYRQLFTALEQLFSCFTIRHCTNETKIMDPVNGTEYVPTYEDKEGDWMLIGDVPWKLFVESCNRLRLMKSSEVKALAPRAPPKSTG